MGSYEDIAEALAQEVLTDVAESFFGTRKHIDDMTELLNIYVQRLKDFEKEVCARAGLINYLFILPNHVKNFFDTLAVQSSDAFINCKFSSHVLPKKLRFSFTAKGEFLEWVTYAYSSLQQSCHEYLYGRGIDDTGAKSIYRKDIYLNLVKNMCRLINDRIERVNKDMPPFSILQYVRQFDPEYESKAHLAIAGYQGESSGINEKLAYQPINFNSFQLTEFPELPPIDKVLKEITDFSNQFYSWHKDDLVRRLYWLKDQIRKK